MSYFNCQECGYNLEKKDIIHHSKDIIGINYYCEKCDSHYVANYNLSELMKV